MKGQYATGPYDHQHPVLIKRLKPGATGAHQLAEFKNDAAILARMRHENIIKMEGTLGRTHHSNHSHDAHAAPPPAIVTEYMDSTALNEYLRVGGTVEV